MELYLQEKGKDKDEIILFLHGKGLAGWMWNKQIDDFNDYHCIVPDLPGHGKSKKIKPFTIKRSADMIIELIQDRCGNKKVHMVGISLGAQIILQVMDINPEVVDKVLISGTVTKSTSPTPTFLKLFDYFIEAYKPEVDINFFIKAYMRMYHIPKSLFNEFKDSAYLINDDALNEILKENMLFKAPVTLNVNQTPVLVMTGEKDYKIIKKSASNLLNLLPNSKGRIALDVGHLWNIEKPELFNETLKAWINDFNLPDSLEKF